MGEQKQGAIAMNETVKVGGVEWSVSYHGIGRPKRGPIHMSTKGCFSEEEGNRIIAALRAATPSPAPAEKAVKPRFAVGDTVQSQYESNPCTVERVIEDPRGFRYLVRYPNRQVYLTNGESMDLVHPSPPSPSPTALAAAEEIARHYGFGGTTGETQAVATILDRHFAPELTVVEAAKVWRAIQGHACEDACCIALCDALDALSAREGGAA